MNITETGALLAKVQAFDNRTVDEAVLMAWQEILEPHILPDCLAAVKDYYRRNSKWIMPSHVVSFVEDVEARRLRDIRGDVRLSDRDEEKFLALGGAAWAEQMRVLRRMVASGGMSAVDFATYSDGNLELETFTPIKAIRQ